MFVKRILILFPLALIFFLAQSFFWVPTYDKQALGNPERLKKYIRGSAADAEILNPILSADTSSSSINDLVFDGLISLDDQMEYRPRLAESWTQSEVAYLTVDPGRRLPGIKEPAAADWLAYFQESVADHPQWKTNVVSAEVVPGEIINGSIQVPVLDDKGLPVKQNGRPRMEDIAYTLRQPDRIKFVLRRVDQDFFIPLQKRIGDNYFESFPHQEFVRAENPAQQEKLQPYYAEILPVIEHNPVIVFELRKGVRFHDGHEFDSADVLFTYRAIMDPKNASPRRSDYEPVKSAETLGPSRIRFTYKRLFSPAINSWFMGILPEHLLNDEALKKEARNQNADIKNFTIRDSRFNRHPIGTGPFRFTEWKSDELIRLQRNDDYWEGPAEYDEYVMRVIPDALTQEMEFYAGAVDNYNVQPHQVARFKKEDKFQSFSSLGYFFAYIGYNMRNPLFASPEVRRALGMAIDVDQIIKYVLYGEGERVTGPYPKMTDWYDPDVQPLPYDPEAALKILNRLGWKKNADGFLEKEGKVFEFNLITNAGNPIRKNILTIAQNGWRKLGIKCNTQLFEWAVFLKDFVNALKFDAVVLGWSMGIDPDLYQIWHSSQTGPRQLNFIGYENPEADRLIVRIRREYDKEKQVRMTRQLHRIIARDQPYTFLYVAKATQLLDRKIVIVEPQADGSEKYVKIYPTRDGAITYYFNKWRKLNFVPQFNSSG
ncbi:peptide ABC transporter substrate-binding protein [Candidatus Nitromaritima sp. SCGC AAA799-A02]|nr:peptide ABC transporter substrate-binding protein [Candidatus Nitromaritima sp. SCGC AAA799-A02]KMP12361.1 peptide ABC transporter substrate-binding protein [Candidatus Nitromaritima sp. SCGC AAA799-C22]